MPLIIELMQDPSMVVRDSAAWTVGRVCELLPDEAINPLYLDTLLDQMMRCLAAEPRVAANSCWVSSHTCSKSQRVLFGSCPPILQFLLHAFCAIIKSFACVLLNSKIKISEMLACKRRDRTRRSKTLVLHLFDCLGK